MIIFVLNVETIIVIKYIENNNRKTSFDLFQEIIDNYEKKQSMKNKSILEVIV